MVVASLVQKSEECVQGVGVKGPGSYFSNMPIDVSLPSPVIYFVCNQPGPLTFFSFGSRPYTLLRILLSDHVIASLWQIQQTAKTPCFSSCWLPSNMWKAGESTPQVASPSRSILTSLEVASCSKRVQETLSCEMQRTFWRLEFGCPDNIVFLPDCMLVT